MSTLSLALPSSLGGATAVITVIIAIVIVYCFINPVPALGWRRYLGGGGGREDLNPPKTTAPHPTFQNQNPPSRLGEAQQRDRSHRLNRRRPAPAQRRTRVCVCVCVFGSFSRTSLSFLTHTHTHLASIYLLSIILSITRVIIFSAFRFAPGLRASRPLPARECNCYFISSCLPACLPDLPLKNT